MVTHTINIQVRRLSMTVAITSTLRVRAALPAAIALLSLAIGQAALSGANADDEGAPAGTEQLYNGRNLDGWQHIGPGRFVMEDGLLKTEGGMGLLWYKGRKFGDCVLRVVYKTTKESDNSGVYIRIAEEPSDPWYAVHHGYEIQIADGGGPYRTTGAVYSFAKVADAAPREPGEWNTLEITLDGDRVRTRLNGKPAADFDPSDAPPELQKRGGMGDPEAGPRPSKGFIGLQNHDDSVVVYFKEVSVRPLAEADRKRD
jgi:hypothetical protein